MKCVFEIWPSASGAKQQLYTERHTVVLFWGGVIFYGSAYSVRENSSEKKKFKLSHNAFWWNLRKRSISNISVKRLTESHTKHAAFLLWVANTLPRTLHADKGNFPCVLQFLLAKNFIFLQQCLSIICPSMSCFADGVVIVCRCLIAQ